jgi:LuxR family quorum-sensing system transcriptional regulator SolR
VLRFEDFVQASQRAETTDELKRLYAEEVGTYGYENCVLTSLRGRKVEHIAWFDFPAGYLDAYLQNRWDLIDPILVCSVRALRPFLWNDVVAQTRLSDAQLRLMEECRKLNVHSGIAFPFHGPNQRNGLMSISRRVADPPNLEVGRLLHAISVQTWNRHQELAGEALFVGPEIVLTPRELEILRWCKDGKSRPEIGDILSISTKTVEFHLRSVMDKLGANNQISAVVIALQKGLIDL